MRLFFAFLPLVAIDLVAQETPATKDSTPINVARGIPPRASAGDYGSQAKVGPYTIAADFARHSFPTPDGTFTSEDYVVVEVAFFGEPGGKITLANDQFSLRINGKKMPTPSVLATVLLPYLKDPNWEPPVPPEGKSKGGGISAGGAGAGAAGDPKPLPPKMPMELRLAMSQKVQRSALMSGERALPQAGLLFFPFRGRAESIKTVELLYTSPAGTTVLNLEP